MKTFFYTIAALLVVGVLLNTAYETKHSQMEKIKAEMLNK